MNWRDVLTPGSQIPLPGMLNIIGQGVVQWPTPLVKMCLDNLQGLRKHQAGNPSLSKVLGPPNPQNPHTVNYSSTFLETI